MLINSDPKQIPARTTHNFLPGPVRVSEQTKLMFSRAPVSHRSAPFLQALRTTKDLLKQMTHCRNLALCQGSGTLANDIVAGQLAQLHKKGLILANGEFGERLIDHALRFQLDFVALRLDWGNPFNFDQIQRIIQSYGIGWLWCVQHETSTGLLLDLSELKDLARKNGFRLALDCISSIGAVPVDLKEVDLVSGTSGKALQSYPGISFVGYKQCFSAPTVARYLDLNLYAKENGVPFTFSSNLLFALQQALQEKINDASYPDKIRRQTCYLRQGLKARGIPLLIDDPDLAPVMTTIPLKKSGSSNALGQYLQRRSFHVHYQSDYLLKRNWVQISSMSLYPHAVLDQLIQALSEWMHRRRSA